MIKRHTKQDPCPACGGSQDDLRGQGVRCIGFSGGEDWFHCSRLGEGTRCKYHEESQTWSHRAKGSCPCGTVHADDPDENRPPSRRRKPADVTQIGDTDKARIVETYDYETVHGRLMYQVCRTEPKSFRQRRPDGNLGWNWSMKAGNGMAEQPTTLYRLPDLIPGLLAGDTIYIVEGEKDVNSIRDAGGIGTCNTGGAGKWRDELSEPFKTARAGAYLIIIQDKDPADHKGVSGQEHAKRVYESLEKVIPEGVNLSIREAAVGKDASDHLEAGKTITSFLQVWPIPDDLLESNPQVFKRFMLLKALEAPKTVLSFVNYDPIEREKERDQPRFHTGIFGAPFYTQWRGAVAISGEPSAGKSYVAISTAVDAALAGWDAFYLSCEMHEDLIRDRAARAVASHAMSDFDLLSPTKKAMIVQRARTVALPDTWHHLDVGIGITIEMVVEMLADNVAHRPTLVVLDSISSFVDSMDAEKGDAFGMGNLKNCTRWITATRKLTHGHIAWLLLSELNKEGRAKGRSLDHRCDTAISMKTDPEQPGIKLIEMTKNWWGPTGSLGSYVLDWELGRLVHEEEDFPT